MTTAPAIVLTQADLTRLERLLDGLEHYGPAAEALEHELSRARVVETADMPATVVTMNSRVHCRDETTGKDYHLTLVYPQDAGRDGTVSVMAPVGTALLGLTAGQHIDWPGPGAKLLRLTVLAVEAQPNTGG